MEYLTLGDFLLSGLGHTKISKLSSGYHIQNKSRQISDFLPLLSVT